MRVDPLGYLSAATYHRRAALAHLMIGDDGPDALRDPIWSARGGGGTLLAEC